MKTLTLLAALLVACNTPTPAARPTPAPVPPVPTTPAPTPSGAPIYDLELSLTDAEGQRVGLDTWRGHPTVVVMFYASCPAACPVLISEVQAFERRLDPKRRADLRVLLVSFDAQRDTPQALTELGRAHHVDMARWRLTAAPEDQARELAAVLGVKYRRLDSGEYFHTSVITLVDEEGRPLGRLDGLGHDSQPLVDALAAR